MTSRRPSILNRSSMQTQTELSTQEDQICGYRQMAQNRHQVARTTRRVFGINNYNRTLEITIDPERQLEISRERRANLVPAEVLYSNNRSTARHRVYEHYSEQRILCVGENQINLRLCNEESYENLRNSGLRHIYLGIFMIRLHALHRRSTGTNALVVIRDTRWEDRRLSNTSYTGFQYSVENVVDHLTTNGITAIPGERRSINELEGMSWNLKPPEQMFVRVSSRVAVNERLNRSVSLRFEIYRQAPQPSRYSVDQHDREVIGNDNLDEDEEHFVGICLQTPQIEHTPYDTTPIEEIAANGWGEEFSDDEVTPAKQDVLDEYLPQWDDHLATQKQESELEWENPFAAKRFYPPAQQNPQPFYRPDYQFGYPQGKGKSFSGRYGEYYNSQWTLPPAWTESGVMLVLPADPGLWSEVISRWESVTINRLNNQTWSDNKEKLAFVENLLGESKTHELRPGYLALNESSIFLDNEGKSLAKSFSVVEGKYSLPDLVANCLKSSKNNHRINCLTCDVIFYGSSDCFKSRTPIWISLLTIGLGLLVKQALLSILSMPVVESIRDGHPIVVDWFCASFSCMTRFFPPLLSSSSQSLPSSDPFRIVTFPGVTSSSENSSPQPVAAISSIGVVFRSASYLT
nr:hypothetical protein AMTR_s00071p00160380 [Tanacetum cinerariifolium]